MSGGFDNLNHRRRRCLKLRVGIELVEMPVYSILQVLRAKP